MLLPYEYWPSLSWMHFFYNSSQITLQQHGHYQKQSLFNRCHIVGRNGPLTLSVPLLGGREQKTAVSEILIDNTQRWATQQLRTLKSCYGKAPFFDYYFPSVENILLQRPEKLIDLNKAILNQLIRWLKWPGEVEKSETYQPVFTTAPVNEAILKPYVQVFAGSVPFAANLSVLDGLMCMGPQLSNYLQD